MLFIKKAFYKRLINILAVLALLLITVPLPHVSANAPTSRSVSLAVRMPSFGNASIGTSTLSLSYTTDGLSAKASSSSSAISLGANRQYKLTQCLATRTPTKAPARSCTTKVVSTVGASGTTNAAVSSPTPITISRLASASGQQPWVWSFVNVDMQIADANGGTTWANIGTSWPANSLAGGGLAVAAQGQTTAALPAIEGIAVDPSQNPYGPAEVGVNTGFPNSVCQTDTLAPSGSLSPGVTTSGLTNMPAYYEWGAPSGAYAGQAPVGYMIVIHGGAWYANGVGAVASVRGNADEWRNRGWQTLNIDYRACDQSILDVLTAYDRLVAQVPDANTKPVCALGASAGGHLALELAVWRPNVKCVVSMGGPANLDGFKTETAYDATTGQQTNGPRGIYNNAVAAFGSENLPWYSPAYLPPTNARLLLANGVGDPLIPVQQMYDLRDAMLAKEPNSYVDVDELPIGDQPFVHSRVTQASVDDFIQRETNLVAPLLNP